MQTRHSIPIGSFINIWFCACFLFVAENTLAGPQEDRFPLGHCIVVGKIQKELPTVVITHGWRYRNSDFEKPTAELLNLGQEINARLMKELPCSPARSQQVNIILYLWPEASHPLHDGSTRIFSLASACRNIGGTGQVEGGILAAQLKLILGKNYRQPVQFIGHSFGAVVNAFAVRSLADDSKWRSDIQFTILDSAIGFTLLSSKGFRQLLPDAGSVRVLWVDNYMGIPMVAVGTEITGAGPASLFGGGTRLARTHSGTIEYYRETVKNSTEHDGFYYSVLLKDHGGWNARTPAVWIR